jgi:uncharacterized protein (TIGR00156 family)
MKKISILAVLGVVVMGTANADSTEGMRPAPAAGGFADGTVETIVTVQQVKEMRDDTPVVVVGQITQRAGSDDEEFIFQDATGSIIVEIDDEDWRGQTVKPTDTVKLRGEVDRGLFKRQIDVDFVEIIPAQ